MLPARYKGKLVGVVPPAEARILASRREGMIYKDQFFFSSKKSFEKWDEKMTVIAKNRYAGPMCPSRVL